MSITLREAPLTPGVMQALLRLSADWEAEGSCRGYHKNGPEHIEGNRVFLAEEDGEIIGYLFGHRELTKSASSLLPEGAPVFEVEELYVRPACRSRGVGKALFAFAESKVSSDVDCILLSTATKNCRAILHFYLDEVGMEFWSARLFKKV